MENEFVFLLVSASFKGHRCIHLTDSNRTSLARDFVPAQWFFFLSHLFTYLNRACHHCSSLKTSLTKWKPDFDSAASEYAKAGNQWRRRVLRSNRRPSTYYYLLCDCLRLLIAVCFKNAKQFEQAKDAYLKEAEYHTENKTYPITWPV